MISMSLLVVVLLLFAARTSSANSYVWHEDPATGHQYALTTSSCDWSGCEAEANTLGLHLVTISSQEENDWLANTFEGVQVAGESWQPQNLWIGYVQSPGAGTPDAGWYWIDPDEPSTYTNWWPTEPNDYSGAPEDAAVIHVSQDSDHLGEWNDLMRDVTGHNGALYGIIENPVPEPSTALLLALGLSGLAATRRRR
jgi:hypothetical protein